MSVSALPVRPVGGLMDHRFIYVPARETNIRLTFERIRAANPLPLRNSESPK